MRKSPFDITSMGDQGTDRQEADYDEFEATELYCPNCGQAVPVRKSLLLILPEGDKYEYRCQYCGGVFVQRDLNLDHVVPLSRGGRSEWTNVVAACVPCNGRKGNRFPEEAGMRLIRQPKKPAGHPLLRANWIGRFHEEWKTFLDEAYWNVELSDEVVPRRG